MPSSTARRARHGTEIPFTLKGIPCIIRVDYFHHQPGSFSYNAPSDLDYHGYTEIEFAILDRKGYAAPWLEKKVDDNWKDRIEAAICEHYLERDEP